ncbi:MAG: hypothetical protein Q9222_002305 [Ikaeria aurantiellina]
MSDHRLFRFQKPSWLNSPNTRTAGVYLAGALFSIGFFFFIDASTYSHSHLNAGSEVHVKFVDWIPGICSALGMLVINSIEKTRLSADSYSYSGTGVAWKARLVLFLGFALMAGGLAGSVAVLVLKYVVPEYGFPALYFGIANVVANGLIMLSSVVLWVSQNMEDDYTVATTSPKPPKKRRKSPVSIVTKDNDKSKRATPAPATNEKVETEDSRKPSAEAEKLQHLLHEKFIAKRKKDAIAVRNSDETLSRVQSKLPKASEQASQEKSTKTSRKGSRAARRKEAKIAVKAAKSHTEAPEQSTQGTFESMSTSSLPQQAQKSGKGRKRNSDSKTEPITAIGSTKDKAKETPQITPPDVASPDTGIIKQLKSRLMGLTEVLKAKGAANPSPSPIRSSPSSKVITSLIAGMHDQELTIVAGVSKKATLRIVHTKVPNITIRKTFSDNPPLLARQDHVRSSLEQKPSEVKVRRQLSGPKDDTTANVKKTKDLSGVKKVNVTDLKITALDMEQPPVPHLSYGLERVLFNPGVYHLQDPRSRVFNFDPYLQTIMPVTEFDFHALKEYITSSRDTTLRDLAQAYSKRYVGSSSSMTGILAHFHFLLSQWRAINTSMLSREFPNNQTSKFTELQRTPSAIFLKWRDGSYAIDADKEFAGANVLMLLGKSMEKLLTLQTEVFEKYRKSNPEKVSAEEQMAPESYHYSTMGDFIMRSQLDAHDPRLPGTGMFDLKTRAVVSIRMDASNFEEGAGYQIKSRQGAWESFEREYFDMIRAAFLKYSLQVRMGRMDGIFVAFHNTDRIFGFQYISLSEMDSTLHGQWDTSLGDQEFKLSLSLLNEILNKATKKYPDTSLRLHFETREAQTPFMYVFAEPVTEEQITNIQTANDEKIRQFEQSLFGTDDNSKDTEAEDQGWEHIQASVQNAMDEDIRDPNHNDGRHDLEPTMTNLAPKTSEQSAAAEKPTAVDSRDITNTLETATEDGSNERSRDSEDIKAENVGSIEPETIDASQNRSDVGPQNINKDQKFDNPATGNTETTTVPEESENRPEAAEKKGGTTVANNMGGMDEAHEKDPKGARSTNAGKVDELEATEENSNTASHRQVVHEDSTVTIAKESETIQPKESVEPASEQKPESGDDFPTIADVPFIEHISQSSDVRPNGKEVLAMTLTIRNKVNDAYVLRPDDLRPNDKWSVEYALDEVSKPDRAWSLYQACQMRRKKKLDDVNSRSESDDEVDGYIRMLREMSKKGAEWRKKQDERDKASPIKVLGQVLKAENQDAA